MNTMMKMFSSLCRAINRLFIRQNWFWSLSAIVRIVGTAIFYLVAEYRYSNLLDTACMIATSVITIEPEMATDVGNSNFVYMRSQNVVYPKYADPDFLINVTGAIVARTVKHCQWLEEGFDSTDKQTRTRRYLKVWSDEVIDSSEFMDQRFYNPVGLGISAVKFAADARVGNFVLTSVLFNSTDEHDEVFVPSEDDLNAFAESEAHRNGFKYVGDGVFYYSVNGTKRGDMCTPGDMRVMFRYYAPEKLTVVGFQENGVIGRKKVRGMMMGAVRRGYMSPSQLLTQQHRDKRKFAVVARIVAMMSSIILITDHSASPEGLLWNNFMFGILILTVRSIIWQTTYLNPIYWIPILLGAGAVYTTREEQYVTFD